jgi:hypothetical protein
MKLEYVVSTKIPVTTLEVFVCILCDNTKSLLIVPIPHCPIYANPTDKLLFYKTINEITIALFEEAVVSSSCALRGPYTCESGSRVRLGELDSGAGLGLISPRTHEHGDPHTDEFGSLEPEPSRTREPDSYVYVPL